MKRARIIYNPTSGKELFKTQIHKVIEAVSKKGYVVEVFPTKGVSDAVEIARESALTEEVSLLVISGGDGTLHEVVNGLAERPYRPTLLYIPSGTTNDFAKSVGLSTNVSQAMKLLDDGVVKKFDIGKIEDKYFVYVACFGAFTKVSYSTPSKLKSVFGQLAYVFSGVADLQKLNDPFKIKVEANGEVHETDTSIFLVANSTSVAGLKNLLPEAKIDDGVFDVINLNSKTSGVLPNVIKHVATGVKTNINAHGLLHFESDEVRVTSEKEIKWNLDGELGIVGNVTIKCLRQHIEMILPK